MNERFPRDADPDKRIKELAKSAGMAPAEWMWGFLKTFVEESPELDREIPRSATVEEWPGEICHVTCSQSVRLHLINRVVAEAANPHELTSLTEVMLASENYMTFEGTFPEVAKVLRGMGVTAFRA